MLGLARTRVERRRERCHLLKIQSDLAAILLAERGPIAKGAEQTEFLSSPEDKLNGVFEFVFSQLNGDLEV